MKKVTILLITIFVLANIVNAQDISGIVTDDRNLPIFAANVYFESNPHNGTISDMDGYFSIPYTYDKDTLIIAFIGYQNKKIPAVELKRIQRIS
ncbi:MAG: carboxypeptidase-like regulatory domain-containing protein [Parabacteroides merdae]